jgi:hypothetical protein
MTEHSPSGIGTVAQEAARLIEDVATMARASYSGGNNAGSPPSWASEEHLWSDEARQPGSPAKDRQARGAEEHGEPADGACAMCGARPSERAGGESVSACKICPLCRGISLLRSVRPETVDALADLAMSVAASLRDVATWSRTAEPSSQGRAGSAKPTSAGSPEADRAPVQDIPVDDEVEL